MRSTFFAVACLALLSTLDVSVPLADAKSLSNRHPGHQMEAQEPRRRSACSANKRAKAAAYRSTTTSSKKTTSTRKTTSTKKSSTSKSTSTTSKSTSTTFKTTSTTSKSISSSSTSTPTSTSTSSATSTSTSSSASSTSSSSPAAGAAPPNSPWGNSFTLTATAFQPNWKGEATTTWCGIEFDKTSPILALPLADLSKAYGSSTLVTYYSNQALWTQMVSDWCGREVMITGPAGTFKAYFGDANTWSSVDLNMNLFTTLKGVATGSYADPDAAGWMNGIKGYFTGNQVSLKSGYSFAYN